MAYQTYTSINTGSYITQISLPGSTWSATADGEKEFAVELYTDSGLTELARQTTRLARTGEVQVLGAR